MKASDIKPGTIYAIAPANSIGGWAAPILVVDVTTPAHFQHGSAGDNKLHRTSDTVHAAQREYVGFSGKIEDIEEHLARLQGIGLDVLIGKHRSPSLLPRDKHGHPVVSVTTFRLRDVRSTWADHAAEQEALTAAAVQRRKDSRQHDTRQRERFELLKSAAIAKGLPAEGIEQTLTAIGTSQSMGNTVQVSQETLAFLLGIELPERIGA